MRLGDYFDFHTEPVEHVRIKGTRIDIDLVIESYQAGKTPEQIAEAFRTLELVQVYASLTYYLQNRAEMDDYMARREKIAEANYRASLLQPPSAAVARIKAVKAARSTADRP